MEKRISYIPQNFSMISDNIIENIIFDNDIIILIKKELGMFACHIKIY